MTVRGVGLSEAVSMTSGAAPPPLRDDLASLRRQLLQQGYCEIPRILTDVLLERLRAEAWERLPDAELVDSALYEIGVDDLLYPPRRQYSASGPVLRSVQTDRGLVALTRLLTGRLMVPTGSAAYWFYDSDGFIGLHRDVGDCQFVLLIRALGTPDPITVYPQLVGRTTEELLEIATEGDGRPAGGVELTLPENGAAVLWGSVVPHQRLAGQRGERVGVGTVCYRALF